VSREDYEQYVSGGADSLSTSAMKRALDWRSQNPAEAFEVRQANERARREAEAEELLREQWVRDGGDLSQFQKVYRELSAEKRKERLRRVEDEAHASAWRSFRSGF